MYNNNRESERLNRGSKSGGHHDLSFYSGASCPSPARPYADQPCYSPSPAYVDGGAQHSRWHKCDEYFYRDEQMRSFESNRFGEETYNYHDYHLRSFDTSRSGGQCWLNGSRSVYSSHGRLSSSSSEADVYHTAPHNHLLMSDTYCRDCDDIPDTHRIAGSLIRQPLASNNTSYELLVWQFVLRFHSSSHFVILCISINAYSWICITQIGLMTSI